MLDCKATDTDDATVDPRFGRVGKQTIHDTGPLTKKRMETIDDDIADRSVDYIKRQAQAGQPFFLWVNFTHMHFRTHVKPESRGQSGRWQSEYHDVMIDHDKNVGAVLKALDDAGIADNTFVMYSTDNGPNMFSWPDAAMTPFRNEKNTNWEGAYRVPCVVRWPGKIKPGTVSNEMVAHHDWLPTFLAMAGDPEVTDKLLKGYTIGDMTYKVHLDGYNLVPYLTGEAQKSPRVSFIYCNDDQQVVALRYDNWKIVFAEQRAARHVTGLVRAVRHASRTKDLQSPHGSLRARRHHLDHLLRLACRSRLLAGAGAGLYRGIPADLQGIPAAPEGRQLQPRRGAPEDAGEHTTRNPAEPDIGRLSGMLRRPPSAVRRSGRWRNGCISLQGRRRHHRCDVVDHCRHTATAEAFFTGLRAAFPAPAHRRFREILVRYGRWLVAGLTFQLAADIIGTSIAPSWQEVGQLGAIAVIRTFLNYFLERDLAELGER